MAKLERHTLFIDDEAEAEGCFVLNRGDIPNSKNRKTLGRAEAHGAIALPNPYGPQNHALVPVFAGSPWNHYECKFVVEFGTERQVVKSRKSSARFMIRTICGSGAEKHLVHVRSIHHPSLERVEEIFDSSEGLHIVSEYLAVSLLQIYRSPEYPTEPELSSILKQTLEGLAFLQSKELIYETFSCANILLSIDGQLKISDLERCTYRGDEAKMIHSFGIVMNRLMDKERVGDREVGLTQLRRWSDQAADMLAMTTATDIKFLLNHSLLEKACKEDLKFLVTFATMAARIDYDVPCRAYGSGVR